MWGFVDNPNKVNAGLIRARRGTVVVADGRMMPSMADSKLLLSSYGRLAGLWVRFPAPPGQSPGSCSTLFTDSDFNPVEDLASLVPPSPETPISKNANEDGAKVSQEVTSKLAGSHGGGGS
eukprot:1749905-Pyramimonas_sp.AAC.1